MHKQLILFIFLQVFVVHVTIYIRYLISYTFLILYRTSKNRMAYRLLTAARILNVRLRWRKIFWRLEFKVMNHNYKFQTIFFIKMGSNVTAIARTKLK